MEGTYLQALHLVADQFQQLQSQIRSYSTTESLMPLGTGIIELWLNPRGIHNLIKIMTLSSSETDKKQEQSFRPVTVNPDDKLDQQDKEEDVLSKNYVRGPYKNYTTEEKQRAVQMLRYENATISQVSRHLNIPCKNIKRWSQEGISRKKGGGRKRFDPQMEDNIYASLLKNYAEGSQLRMEAIQRIALSYSRTENFKASRGWLLKFIVRYRLREMFKLT